MQDKRGVSKAIWRRQARLAEVEGEGSYSQVSHLVVQVSGQNQTAVEDDSSWRVAY
jgi:hypothetical protein